MKKINIYFGLFMVLVFMGLNQSCRKEIDYVVKRVDLPIEDKPGWELIDDTYTELHQLVEYQGKLYVGGTFTNSTDNYSYLATWDENGYSKAINTQLLFGGGVYTLRVIDDKLWIGGDFSYLTTSIKRNLLCLDGTSITGFSLGITFLGKGVTDVLKHGNDIVVVGSYWAGSSNPNQTNYINKINAQNQIIAFPKEVDSQIYDAEVYNGELVVSVYDRVNASYYHLASFNGTDWEDMGLAGMSTFNDSYGLIAHDGKLFYALNSWQNDGLILKKEGSSWWSFAKTGIAGNGNCYFKVLNNTLYAFGSGLTLNNSPVSNVLMYREAAEDWYAVGEITEKVNDLEYYNNALHAATNNGLYKLNN